MCVRRSFSKLIVAILFACSANCCFGADRPPFVFPQPFGPHGVGFKLVEQYDHTRSFAPRTGPLGEVTTGERDRPVQTLVWYPAAAVGTRVTLGRYLALSDHQYTFLPAPKNRALATQEDPLAKRASETMHAVENAFPESGAFPLIVYAASFSASSFENADLCEYLASFGFVVIASPSIGAHGPMTGDGLEGVHAQAQDISFLIGFAESLKQVDIAHVAVIGYSWGGLSNFFAAANDDRISALVCLDGSARYFPKKIEDSKEVYPHRLTIPVLFFTSMNQSLEEVIRDQQDTSASVLNDLIHSNLFIVNMQQMVHEDFAATSERVPSGTANRPATEFTDKEIATSYGWMARYTLEFLQDELKGETQGEHFIQAKPHENGVPAHVLTITYQPGSGYPITVQALAVKAHKDGFDHLPEIYAEAKKSNGEDLGTGDLISWGEQLVGQGYVGEGIDVMKLTISLHPDIWYPYRVLSQAYVANHQNELAIATLKELLERDPQNEFGRAYLKSLESTPQK
jgi:dienelactone hydrolase